MLFCFINIHRESRNTRNWFRYETFIYLIEFKLFRHEERERHNFFLCWLFHLTPPRAVAAAKLLVWPRWAPKIDLIRPSPNLNSFCFFQIPKSSALPGMMSFTSPVHILSGVFIVTSLIVTSAPHAREHLHSMCAPN